MGWDMGFGIVAVGVGVIGMGLDDWECGGRWIGRTDGQWTIHFPAPFYDPVPITTSFHFTSLLLLTPLRSPLSKAPKPKEYLKFEARKCSSLHLHGVSCFTTNSHFPIANWWRWHEVSQCLCSTKSKEGINISN